MSLWKFIGFFKVKFNRKIKRRIYLMEFITPSRVKKFSH